MDKPASVMMKAFGSCSIKRVKAGKSSLAQSASASRTDRQDDGQRRRGSEYPSDEPMAA
jgi:hypothetical protein